VVICKLLTMVAVLAHMEACLFWFIGAVQEPNGWMHEMGVIDEMMGQPWRQYLISLYWAITTFTTVGYGDLHPVNQAEQTFVIFVMVRRTPRLPFSHRRDEWHPCLRWCVEWVESPRFVTFIWLGACVGDQHGDDGLCDR
jgi:hypothetical protein